MRNPPTILAEVFYSGAYGAAEDDASFETALIQAGLSSVALHPEVPDATRDASLIDAVYIYLTVKAADTVLDAALGHATEQVLDKVEQVALAWMKRRDRKKRSGKGQYLALLDSDSKVLRAWQLAEDKEMDRTLRDRGKRRRKPKKGKNSG